MSFYNDFCLCNAYDDGQNNAQTRAGFLLEWITDINS